MALQPGDISLQSITMKYQGKYVGADAVKTGPAASGNGKLHFIKDGATMSQDVIYTKSLALGLTWVKTKI